MREVEGQALPCSVLVFMLSILGWGEEEEEEGENEVERRGSWKALSLLLSWCLLIKLHYQVCNISVGVPYSNVTIYYLLTER